MEERLKKLDLNNISFTAVLAQNINLQSEKGRIYSMLTKTKKKGYIYISTAFPEKSLQNTTQSYSKIRVQLLSLVKVVVC